MSTHQLAPLFIPGLIQQKSNANKNKIGFLLIADYLTAVRYLESCPPSSKKCRDDEALQFSSTITISTLLLTRLERPITVDFHALHGSASKVDQGHGNGFRNFGCAFSANSLIFSLAPNWRLFCYTQYKL